MTSTDPDAVMEAISRSVSLGRDGDAAKARHDLLAIWRQVGVLGDPLHRCTLAHHLADLYDDPAQALVWDVRALDAADALTDQRVQDQHASLYVAGFYPSLHLNLADDFRRLGAFEAAAAHIEEAGEHAPSLLGGSYGDTIRDAIREVREAIAERDTTRRPSAPGPAQ